MGFTVPPPPPGLKKPEFVKAIQSEIGSPYWALVALAVIALVTWFVI